MYILPRYKKGIRPGLYLVEPDVQETLESDSGSDDDVIVSHDGWGNVTVVAPKWTISEDEEGNLHITGNKISITEDDTGGIEMKTITINGMTFEVVDQQARDALANKADTDHSHAPASVGGTPTVAAAGDGEAYTAAVEGVTELYAGLIITIIPDTTSTTTIPTLDVNGLGAKRIKQKNTVNTSATLAAEAVNWMVKSKPLLIMFDGTQWATVAARPTASDMYGIMEVVNGGTGAETAEEALSNLLPAGGTAGQVLTISEEGKAVWADAAAGESIPSAEGVSF